MRRWLRHGQTRLWLLTTTFISYRSSLVPPLLHLIYVFTGNFSSADLSSQSRPSTFCGLNITSAKHSATIIQTLYGCLSSQNQSIEERMERNLLKFKLLFWINYIDRLKHKQHFLFWILLYTHTSICHNTWEKAVQTDWIKQKSYSELKQERKLKMFNQTAGMLQGTEIPSLTSQSVFKLPYLLELDLVNPLSGSTVYLFL